MSTSYVRWGVAVAVAIAGGAWFFANKEPPLTTTVIRVGVDHSPPFYSIGPDHAISGLAVDVFNEAARRVGVRLQWVAAEDTPIDQQLTEHRIQMWPLVAATEERRKKFYLSEPWLESDYVLVSLDSHRIRNAAEAAGGIMAHARLRTTAAMAQRFLPQSKLIVKLRRSDAVQAVCMGEANGAMVEGRVLDSLLLTRPAGCENTNFSISALPGATTPLAIVAVPELHNEALALRRAITELATDGYLTRKLDEWSPFSAEGARSVWAEQEANARSRVYRMAVGAILILALVLAWVAFRAFRLRRATEEAQSGLREAQRRFTAFMDNSPALAFMKNADGRMLYVNHAWSRVFHRSSEESLGKNDYALFPQDTARELRAVDVQLLAENRPRQLIEEIPVDGKVRELLVVKFPFSNENGERFIGGTAIDITERQSAVRDLEASEARYRDLFENNPLPAWVYNRQTLAFITVNAAALSRYGWSRKDFLTGLTLPDVLADTDQHGDRTALPYLDSALAVSGACWHQTRDGIRLSVEVTSYEMEYENQPARLMIVRDLTEQERTLEQLRVTEERWQLALHGTGDALWDWDIRGGRVFRSPRWRSMLGYSDAEIGDGREDFLRLLHPADRPYVEAAINDYFAHKIDNFAIEYRLLHKNGSWRWIMDRGRAIWDERKMPLRMAGSHTDITERKEAETRLELEAHTDPLTSLPNRRAFDHLLAVEFHLARESGLPLSICVLDLDFFKQVNDTWGHAAGDRVLVRFADSLRQELRTTDLVGRIGGDEFIVAMPGTSSGHANEVAERIRRTFAAFLFHEDNGIFQVTCSCGIAELAASHHEDKDLVEEADRHLYGAKRNRALVAA